MVDIATLGLPIFYILFAVTISDEECHALDEVALLP